LLVSNTNPSFVLTDHKYALLERKGAASWKFRYISFVARCNYHKVILEIQAHCTANFKLSQPSYLSPFSRHMGLVRHILCPFVTAFVQ
jgi:hypothetical protein